MTIYGTRPEAIKLAPVIKAVEKSRSLASHVVVTGQHREMLDDVNAIFEITPHHDLDIMRHGQTLSQIFARVLDGLDPILDEVGPNAVLVQGDTTTSIAAALAAFHRQIPVIHLEAGLRSHDITSPFPEEANRRLTSQLAALHLAPTPVSKANLLAESVPEPSIVVTGNTVIDALLEAADREVAFDDPRLEASIASGGPLLLVTVHRRENWGASMQRVGRALRRLAEVEPRLTVILPIHRNPVVRDAILPHLDGLHNVLVIEPLPYGQFARLLGSATVVLTDSGGIQEEAPALGRPVLVMRENTERPEAVDAGIVRLIGTQEKRIVDEVLRLVNDAAAYSAMARAVNPYGDGRASVRSIAAIEELLGTGTRLADYRVL